MNNILPLVQLSFIDNHGVQEIDGCLVGTRRPPVDFWLDFGRIVSSLAGSERPHEHGSFKR